MYLSGFPQGFAVTGHIDSQRSSRIFVSEVLPEGLAFNEGWRLVKMNLPPGVPPAASERAAALLTGLRPGDEVLVLNGRSVSGLDLTLIQTLFAEQTLQLTLRRDGPPPAAPSPQPAPPLRPQRDAGSKHQRAKSSSGE